MLIPCVLVERCVAWHAGECEYVEPECMVGIVSGLSSVVPKQGLGASGLIVNRAENSECTAI